MRRSIRVSMGLLFVCTVTVFAEDAAPRLTSERLDQLVATGIGQEFSPSVSDEEFLRRVSLDLAGRQPSAAELQAFLDSAQPDKRRQEIERLLASPEFGRTWADYWSDTIAYRTPPPELTFLNYDPFKGWLATQFNDNTGWDQTVQAILSATGKVKDNPPVTFVAYHEAIRSTTGSASSFMNWRRTSPGLR
jgi:hypothetical protein